MAARIPPGFYVRVALDNFPFMSVTYEGPFTEEEATQKSAELFQQHINSSKENSILDLEVFEVT